MIFNTKNKFYFLFIECKKRWTSLRDQFRQNVLKKKTVSGQSADTRVKWWYEDTLSFLLPHMRERAQKSNLAPENNSTDSISNETFIQDDEINISFGNLDQLSVPNSSTNSNTFPSSSSSSTAATTPVSSITDYRDTITSSNKTCNKSLHPQPTTAQVLEKYLASKKAKLESPSDHIGAFFVAMEATTRRLPPILQIEAKAKISALLSDLEMKAYLSNENKNNVASSLQSISTNEYQVCITPTASPSCSPVDFSNHGHRVSYENGTGYSTASSVTENPRSGHEDFFEVNSVDKNYYNL